MSGRKGVEACSPARPYAESVTERELPTAEPDFDDPTAVDPYRLPAGVEPTHYRLTLEPDLDRARFDGHCEIDLDVDSPTSTICCNAIDLSFTSASVTTADGLRLSAATIELDDVAERVTFTFGQEIAPGRVVFVIDFAGTLNDTYNAFKRGK